MPVKWDEKAMADLFVSVISVTCPTMTEDQKDQIVANMQSRGHDINWDAPGLYRDVLAAMATACKPSADTLKEIVEEMNQRGYKFTYHGLK
ncbi:hypothetical protein SCUCBS95973_007671 [Sporothrix curviconia]|uniref:Uncharacterized protein n=1 Tax=Sporothrix curviconia TaxID=1260050 RepID=A0ABP0CH35_9PEZI